MSLHPGAEDRRLPPRHPQHRPAPTALLPRGLEERIQRRLSQEFGQVGHRPVRPTRFHRLPYKVEIWGKGSWGGKGGKGKGGRVVGVL